MDKTRAHSFRTLIPLLQATRVPSRALDRDVAILVGAPQAYFASFHADVDGTPLRDGLGFDDVDGPECFNGQPIWAGAGRLFQAPTYTASLDAVATEAVRVLPGTARLGAVQQPDRSWRCALIRLEPDPVVSINIDGRLPGATLAAALLYSLWLGEVTEAYSPPDLWPDPAFLVGFA